MDGTFGGGDLISASLAIMLGGNGDAELHDKEVTLTTSDVTGSQTAIFEYDPENEPVSGDPAGPWDGYSLFTIDLSGVKDDLEDLQQQVSDLEDELEDCHDCWEDVVAKLQEYDPEYDPDEGECPTEEIEKVIVEKEHEIEALEEQVEKCDQCKADVIAKLQEYDPDFDPQTCEDIPEEIDKVTEYPIPPDDPDNPDPDRYDDIVKVFPNDTLKDQDAGLYVKYYTEMRSGDTRIYITYNFYSTVDDSYISGTPGWEENYDAEHPPSLHSFKVLDPTTGRYEYYHKYWNYHYPGWWYDDVRVEDTDSTLIGYGDPTHNYTLSRK